MTVQMLINELNKIQDKNRKIGILSNIHYPFAQANIKQIENSQFGNTVWIRVENPND